MKNPQKTITLAIACLLVISAAAVKAASAPANIPGNILKQFTNQYPDAKIKKWKVENGNYIAEFKANGRPATSTYTEQGTWEKTVISVKYVRLLPATVSETFNKSKFRNYCVENIKSVSTPSGNHYILDVGNYNCNPSITEGIGNEDNQELKFNASGLLIKIIDLNGPDEDDI